MAKAVKKRAAKKTVVITEENKPSKSISYADIEKYLLNKYEFRHNPILERTEFKLKGKKNSFQLLTERDVNTIVRELNLNHIKCTISTIRSLLNSDFIVEENPFEEYFTNLPIWNNKE